MAKILVIDDEIDLLTLVKSALEKNGHHVTTKESASDIDINIINTFDLIILDVMMPRIDGFTFLKENRRWIDIPVLFLTAKVMEEEILEGFAFGGDDYITKPFSIKELRARVEAHLRRETREKTQRLLSGEIGVDLIEKKFYVLDDPIELTPSEYKLMLLLIKHKQQVFSKEDIYIALYGYDGIGDSATSITERVKKIRHKFIKFGVNPIQTVWGIGYKWQSNQ
ncbi:response regulator transcription factor [Clostridium sp. D2Q-14]|uniref:response regulator transcription factor n=1 Tax=Anaeromonas gelatinilytica TaxID=2683194 RepID=UPI00193BC127|nr:response regulator transcription factor [Anaeromonas gelatinilytica]MBS4535124.1 response regulator transcription factor [Anaeromonas gelatinilytica]